MNFSAKALIAILIFSQAVMISAPRSRNTVKRSATYSMIRRKNTRTVQSTRGRNTLRAISTRSCSRNTRNILIGAQSGNRRSTAYRRGTNARSRSQRMPVRSTNSNYVHMPVASASPASISAPAHTGDQVHAQTFISAPVASPVIAPIALQAHRERIQEGNQELEFVLDERRELPRDLQPYYRQSNVPQQSQANAAKKCTICLEGAGSYATLACSHEFHKGCLTELIDASLKDKNTHNLKCPSCPHKLSEQEVSQITNSPEKVAALNAILKKEADDKKAALPGMIVCKSPDCGWAFANPDNRLDTMRCQGSCKQLICSACGVLAHNGITCAAAAQNKNNRADEEWVRNNTKPCPQCHTRIEKRAGSCNHMVCAKCHYNFCWICSAPRTNNRRHCLCG